MGEIVVDRFLTDKGINHTWVPFNKDISTFNDPDFILFNKTVDLKTTYSDSMWFQNTKFDIYIYSTISDDDSQLYIISYLSSNMLKEFISSGIVKVVVRGDRKDYVINHKDMLPIEILFGGAL